MTTRDSTSATAVLPEAPPLNGDAAGAAQEVKAALITFVVPVYNEEAFIDDVLKRIYALPLYVEVVAVDDGSSDRSWEKLQAWGKSHGLIAIRHERNRGKGAAVRTGFARSTGDVVLVQDADMEYDPHDVPQLIQPIVDGFADVVYGSRLKGGAPQRAHMFWHLVGNRILTLATNVLYNTTLSDMETGYKAFLGDVARGLDLYSDDFRIEPEITAKVLRRRLRIYEIPVAYYGRSFDEGKKITWRDAFPAFAALFRYRFADRPARRRR